MKRSISKESSSVVAGILGFLKDSGKISLLPSVADVLDEAAGKTRRADHIVITSAVPLTAPEISKLRGALTALLRTPLPVKTVVDKRVVAGFSIRVGDFFLDATMAADLHAIKHLLVS